MLPFIVCTKLIIPSGILWSMIEIISKNTFLLPLFLTSFFSTNLFNNINIIVPIRIDAGTTTIVNNPKLFACSIEGKSKHDTSRNT